MKRAILIFVPLLAAAALVIVMDGRTTEPRSDREVAPGDAAQDAPSKENVNYGFRAELAMLQLRLRREPDDTALLARTARLLQDAHQPREAVVYYQRYLELDPANRRVWLDLASAHAGLGQWDDAEKASLAVLERHPGDAEVMYNLGAIHANKGEYAEARDWWEKVKAQEGDGELASLAEASLLRVEPKTE